MLAQVTAALEISQEVERFGAYAGLASILGLAILSLLHFGQARELKRLREWAGRAPERAAELQERAAAYEQQVAAAQAARSAPPAGPVRQAGAPLPPRVGPAVPVGAGAGAAGAAASASAAGQETQAFDANGSVRVLGPVREDGTGPQPAVELPAPAGSPEAAPAAPQPAPAAPAATPAAAPAATGASAPSAVAAGVGAPATAAAGVAPAPRAAGSGAAAPPAGAGPAAPPAGAPGTPATPRPTAGGPANGVPPAPAVPPATGARSAGSPPAAGGPPPARPPGPVRVPAGAVPPPRTAAGAARPRPGAPAPDAAAPRGRGRLLAYAGGGIAALAVAGVLGVTLLGGEDEPAAPPAATQQGNRLEDPATSPAEPAPTLDRSQFSIRVLNGTSVAGVARTVNDRLEERDYTAAAQPANATLRTVPTTTVAYTDGNRRAANDVARILDVRQENVVQADAATRQAGGGADVIVTVGADKAGG
jgi:hypothetical protein